MKKRFLVLLMITLFVFACGKETEKPTDNEPNIDKPIVTEIGYDTEVLNAKLLEYGKLIYENDYWLKGGIEPMTYYMTLTEMSERNEYDISMFYNTVTNKACDPEATRIEFIVSEEIESGKTNYKYNPVLKCD